MPARAGRCHADLEIASGKVLLEVLGRTTDERHFGAPSTRQRGDRSLAYGVKLLYDTTKVNKIGSAGAIKLQLLDAAQNNRSSSSIAVRVTGISPSPAPGVPPSGALAYLKVRQGPGYQLNIKATRCPPNTYTASFTAGADPTTHTAQFVVA